MNEGSPAQVEKKGQNLSGRPNMLAPLPESIPLNPPSQSMPHTLIMVSLIFSDSRGKGSSFAVSLSSKVNVETLSMVWL